MFATLLYYTFYGMMIVAATPNPSIAAIIASSFYGLWNLFSGFIVPRTRMPIWWRWYYWLSPVAWILTGLLTSQYGDLKDVMEDEHITVQEFLQTYFGYRHHFIGVAEAVVSDFALLFAFVFAFSIKVLNFQNR